MAVITGTVGSITISTAAAGGGGGGGLSFGGGAALFFGIYSSPTGGMIADLSGRVQGVTITTNIHGFADLSAFCPMSLEDAFFLYDQAGTPHVIVSERGATVWEGRLEDVAIVNGGVRLKAFGYQRALSDVKITGLYSRSLVSEWRQGKSTEINTHTPEMYVTDTNNRVYGALKKNAAYTSANNALYMLYQVPGGASPAVKYYEFSYNYNLPSNWMFQGLTYSAGFTSGSVNTISSSGGSGAGTFTWTFSASPKDIIGWRIYNNSGSTYTNSSEDGTYYISASAIRVTGFSGSSVGANEIVNSIASYVSGINPTQLQSALTLIEVPNQQLYNELYEDTAPADILTRLAGLGDTAGNVWEWGVYEGQLLHFRARGASGRSWYVDAAGLEVERTIDTLANSVYAVYREDAGRTLRTAASTSTSSESRYGLTRHRAVSTDTTSATQAAYVRDVALTDGADPSPRIGLTFRELYDAAGGRWPLWYARSGDTITIRNLPPTISTSIDRIRTFRISETSYNADSDTLNVTPETPLPALDVFVARKAAGL